MPFGRLLEPAPPEEAIGRTLWWGVAVFALGKFYPLFSLLFGAGFALQRQRLVDRGASFVPIYLRRTFALLLIGAFHAWFIWFGDILFIYAWMALGLLLVSRLGARTLVSLGVGLWLLSAIFAFQIGLLATTFGNLDPASPTSVEPISASFGGLRGRRDATEQRRRSRRPGGVFARDERSELRSER